MAAFGNLPLRYSLLAIAVVTGPWAAWHFYAGGCHLDVDLARADEVSAA